MTIVKANHSRRVQAALADAQSNSKRIGTGASPLAGPIPKGDPKPTDCATCGKTAKRLQRLADEEWECSHVECPCRRKCWSNGTGPGQWKPQPKAQDPLGSIFDKVEV